MNIDVAPLTATSKRRKSSSVRAMHDRTKTWALRSLTAERFKMVLRGRISGSAASAVGHPPA